MYHNVVKPTINEALPDLLGVLLNKGAEQDSRVGKTLELTHVGVTLTSPWRRELLLDHHKPSITAQIAETAWVLAGRNDIEWLSHYLPRAADFSDDGKVWHAGYGQRLRRWPLRGDTADVVDQLAGVVDLLKLDHNTRRAVISIWDPEVDSTDGKDLACNNWLNFSIRGGLLDLHVAVRSNDIIWGWSGINAFEWSVLQEIVAGLVGVGMGSLHFSITSLHIYEQHWGRAAEIVLGSVTPLPVRTTSPRFNAKVFNHSLEYFDTDILPLWFILENRIRSGDYCAAEVDRFPEPMLRSWLRVLQWWWSGSRKWLDDLGGTQLFCATGERFSVQPKREEAPTEPAPSAFLAYATQLHVEKHEAYGDSWKRRGEMLGIMANIARKIDRLGVSGAGDTATDTAVDLMVYLAKYRWWLVDNGCPGVIVVNAILRAPPVGTCWSDHTEAPNMLLCSVELDFGSDLPVSVKQLEDNLTDAFSGLELVVVGKRAPRYLIVDHMLRDAYKLARQLWEADHK